MSDEEQLIEKFESVGKVCDKNGNIITQGANWLFGIEPSKKIGLANLYNSASTYMLNVGGFKLPKTDISVDVMIFPMLRRIYVLLDYEFDFEDFLVYFHEVWDEIDEIDEIDETGETNYEGELVELIAKKIVKRVLEAKGSNSAEETKF